MWCSLCWAIWFGALFENVCLILLISTVGAFVKLVHKYSSYSVKTRVMLMFPIIQLGVLVVAAGVRRSKASWNVDICVVAAACFGVKLSLRLGLPRIQLEGDSIKNLYGLFPQGFFILGEL